MFGNDDYSSNVEINVDRGNGMQGGTVTIGRSEYKQILELAYKAAMLKEAVLNCAILDLYGNELFFGGGNSEVATIFKYAFPKEYENRLRELMDKKTQDMKEGADDEH